MPSAETVREAIEAIKRAANYEYFFSKLDSPDWIEPLWMEGFFQHPPEPVREGDYIRFPLWPESQYLARMAAVAPEMVFRVVDKIPSIDNVRVHEDLADVALNLPPNMAARLVPRAVEWVRSPYQFLLAEKLGHLIKRLAQAGEIEPAFRLTSGLFAILPGDRRTRRRTADESPYELVPEPSGHVDDLEYAEILGETVPDLLNVDGKATVRLLCDLLERAVRLSLRDPENSVPEDYSYVWRDSVATDPRVGGMRNILTSAVRDAVVELSRRDPTLIARLVEELETRRWEIFQRLALHTLTLFGSQAQELMVAHLRKPGHFDRPGTRREYRTLLREQFGHIPHEVQREILSWIQAGPPAGDIQDLIDWHKETSGRPLDPAELAIYKERWKLQRLAPIADNLPPEAKREYLELLIKLGEEQQEEPPAVGAAWVGPTSPKTAEELRAFDVEDLIRFLRDWKPSEQMFSPSREGLGRILVEVVAADPQRYAERMDLFVGLDPTYVRATIRGFGDAAKHGRMFSWARVLDLSNWVLEQPREAEPAGGQIGDRDPGWKWTRNEIAHTLSDGMNQAGKPSEVPFELRSTVWRIIEALTQDPDPTPEDEVRYKVEGMDPLTVSINTVRGDALHTTMDYSHWVWRHLDERSRVRGFDQMPEVRRVLESHLDMGRDSSLAIRSVYGQRFPWLVVLDQRWTKDHLQRVFPEDQLHRDFFDAAWVAYVKFCEPYDNVFALLKKQYVLGVSRLKGHREGERQWDDYSSRLAEHIAIFFGRGTINFEDPSGLLDGFYREADLKTRSHVLGYIGWSLEHARGSIPARALERFQALWLRRSEEVLATGVPPESREELATLGSWFVSGAFDDAWAMEQLIRLLRGRVMPDPLHSVVQRLATLADSRPAEVIDSLELILDLDNRGERVRFLGEHIRVAIGSAVKSADPLIRERTIGLIHRLGSFGLREYRDLLPDK